MECWTWTGALNKDGYGLVRHGGRTRRIHQVVYEEWWGPVPTGKEIDHSCRVRACYNPWHLRAVTHRENVLLGTSPFAKKAAATHCIHGHEFTPENTIARGRLRQCRECGRRHSREYRRRKVLT